MKHACVAFLVLICMASAPALLGADEQAADSILARLSRETADLTAKSDRYLAWLRQPSGARWPGVLVGQPARFVRGLDDVGDARAEGRPTGTLTLADGTVREATRIDGDGEMGLAVFEVSGPPLEGLSLAPDAPARRGALALVLGEASALVLLGSSGGPLDDVVVPAGALGHALLTPSGELLGLPTSPVAADAMSATSVGCAACHSSGLLPSVRLRWLEDWAGRVLRPDGTPVMRFTNAAPQPTHGTWSIQAGFCTRWAAQAAPEAPDSAHHPGGLGGRPGASRWVPAAVIRRGLADLASASAFARPFLGIVIQEEQREGRARGVRIASVLPDSPAAAAKLEPGLHVVEVDGRPLDGAGGFARALARRRPGERLTLAIHGWAEPVTAVLGDRAKEGRDLANAASVGLGLQALSPDLARFLGVPDDTRGVVVREMQAGTPAADAGLQRGDVILDGGGGPIRDVDEFDAVLGSAKGVVILSVQRGAQRFSFQLAVPAAPAGRRAR